MENLLGQVLVFLILALINKTSRKKQRKIFKIEKVYSKDRYVRYDGLLKRLKVYLFGCLFDDIIKCCEKHDKSIITAVKHTFSFVREEFSINVCKNFNRIFLKESILEIIEILFYRSAFNKKSIEEYFSQDSIDVLRLEKNTNKHKLFVFKDFANFYSIIKCVDCNRLLSKTFLDVVEDFKNNKKRLNDYVENLKNQGYATKYLIQFQEIVGDFEVYMNQAKKKKYLNASL